MSALKKVLFQLIKNHKFTTMFQASFMVLSCGWSQSTSISMKNYYLRISDCTERFVIIEIRTVTSKK